MEKNYESETGCCKRFDPKPWDEKQIKLKNRLFLKDGVRCIFHIPIGFDKMMGRDMEKIINAGALTNDPLMLCDQSSMWRMVAYIAVEKEVPGAQMERMSGTFLSKVFEGSYKDSGNWIKEMKDYVKSKKKEIKKLYFFYTMCPSCEKYYGQNYVVLLAQI